MPYSAKQLRDLLWLWGDAQQHGYWRGHAPADPDTPRLSAHFGPRLPTTADFLDLSRAFASLNPTLPRTPGDLGFYRATRQFNRQQEILWLYYCEGWGTKKFRDDWRAMSPEARMHLLLLDQGNVGAYVVPEDGRGVVLIGERLGVKRATVENEMARAIGAMVAFLNPPRERREAA